MVGEAGRRSAAGLASRRRGRPSNRRYPEQVREAALAAIRERYADFGPTLAADPDPLPRRDPRLAIERQVVVTSPHRVVRVGF